MTLVAHPIGTPTAPEPTSPIKPSEALRLGRLTRPIQIIGAMFGGPDEACPLGAMVVGYGGDQDDSYDFLARKSPGLSKAVLECPGDPACLVASCLPQPAMDLTYHLNDDHLWSDDQIIGWLRGHEL